ncbi:hypothetical protein CHS0354_026106 [Potamilus streckersoni]|uniref:Uncharacterized protein n=1 Tax=Potamilus streckersoni TaxID=2493646 RepID=A0AAE0S1I8_9BIVA|nr:hypothetical protein CHS0354_026106 [Potamilus streckersoni]
MENSPLCSPPKIRRMVTLNPAGMVSALVIPAAGDGRMSVNKEVLDRAPYIQESSRSIKPPMPSLPLSWPHSQFQPPSAFLSHLPQMKDVTLPVKSATCLEKVDLKKEDDFEKKMFEDAVIALPDVFHEVFQMHRGQYLEIQNMQKSLKELQDRGKAEAEKNAVLVQELSTVKNKIYLAEEKSRKIEKTCKEHLADIQILVSERANLQYQLEIKAAEHEVDLRKLTRSREKVQNHKEKVKEFEESTSFIHEQIKATESKLHELKQQYDEFNQNPKAANDILSGTTSATLERECIQLKKQITVSEEELKQIYTEIKTEKKEQAQIDQAVKVLHKRNAAQLTRLKRQLKDINHINCQWLDQISVLETRIAETKGNIAE